MYGIILQDEHFHVIPMECIRVGIDKVIATGIEDKITAEILSHKIYLKHCKKTIDKQ